MAINITNLGSAIKVELTTPYYFKYKAQTRYINKGDFSMRSEGNIVYIVDNIYEFQFRYQDITTPTGNSATEVVTLIEAFLDNPEGGYFLEISKGNITGSSTITKFGLNPAVGETMPQDVWGSNGLYVPPTEARIHNISSDNNDDHDGDGHGARRVLIRGINENYNAVSETIKLVGSENSQTSNRYTHIHLMQVVSVGDVGYNMGVITAIAEEDNTVTCTIPIGLNQSTSSIYFVPVGYKGYIMKIRARMSNLQNVSGATIGIYVKPFGGGFQLKTQCSLMNSGDSFSQNDYSQSTPFIVQGKSFIKMTCTYVDNNNTIVEAEYDLILIKD